MSAAFPIAQVSWLPLAALMAAMAAKHFVCDFLLQTTWMARGKERTAGWLAPLAVHCLVHAGGLVLVALAFRPGLWWLAAIDFIVHAAIDRGKALVSQVTRYEVTDERFWWLLGFDQFLHQLTNVGFICVIIAAAP